MFQEAADYDFLICPFTGRKLRYLSEEELEGVNSKIASGELYFYPGAQVSAPLSRALVSEQKTYVYPIIEDILYLKRETAIVSKNRTSNYLKRADSTRIEEFEKEYGIRMMEGTNSVSESFKVCSSEELKKFKPGFSKSGKLFVSIGSCDIDAIHNILFNAHFDQNIHIDFSIRKMKLVKDDLKKGTLMILCDKEHLPITDNAVSSMLSLDFINHYEKKDQETVYEEIKRVMSVEGSSVVSYDKSKPLHAKTRLKADLLSKKAFGIIKPWKTVKIPTISFFGLNTSNHQLSAEPIVSKTSLNRQFS